MKGRQVYLIAIMDWYSRYVIHWAVSPNMEAEFCVEALRHALLLGCCEIFNTDQGSQFTSRDWISTLIAHGISIFFPSSLNSPLGDTCLYKVCLVIPSSSHNGPILVSTFPNYPNPVI